MAEETEKQEEVKDEQPKAVEVVVAPAEGEEKPTDENESNTEEKAEGEAPVLDIIKERLKEKFADKNLDDANTYDECLHQLFGEMDDELKQYHDTDNKIAELKKVHPGAVEAWGEIIKNKMPVSVAFMKYMDGENWLPEIDDPDYELYNKEYNEKLAKAKEREEREEALRQNEEDSYALFDKYASEKGLDEDAQKGLMDEINAILEPLLEKKLSTELFDKILKLKGYDQAIAEATEAGRISGRNENIKAKMEKAQTNIKGDGMPNARGKKASWSPKMISGNRPVIDFDKF